MAHASWARGGPGRRRGEPLGGEMLRCTEGRGSIEGWAEKNQVEKSHVWYLVVGDQNVYTTSVLAPGAPPTPIYVGGAPAPPPSPTFNSASGPLQIGCSLNMHLAYRVPTPMR